MPRFEGNPFARRAGAAPPPVPGTDGAGDDTLRLQVVLSHSGVCSRRHAAEWIASGRVQVDGETIREPGFRVPLGATVSVDGHALVAGGHEPHRTILLNKPRGLICSADDAEGPTVFECLRGVRERLVPVGRLDKESEGLLLLSNDGDLVNRLTHPRYGHVKEYLVTVRGEMDERAFRELSSPMTLEDDGTRLAPVRVEYEGFDERCDPPRHRLRMWLGEGRNRQIRRMCEQVGLRVTSLVRLAVNSLRLPRDLAPGQWRDLTPRDYDLLETPPSPLPLRRAAPLNSSARAPLNP